MQHFCYLRASVFKPNDPNKVSVSMQLALIKETYPDLNLKVFEDRNISGTIKDRPGLNQLLGEVSESNSGGVIYIYKWDRLARNLLLMLELFDFFTENNFTIISITDGIPKEMVKQPLLARVYLQTLWAFSEAKIGIIKDNQKVALSYKRKQGLPLSSKVPYGYSWEGGMAVLNSDEAEVVSLIFKLYVNENIGYGKIVNELFKRDIMFKEKPFKLHNVKDILTNMFYIGMIQGGQFGSYKGKHIPIIDQKLFDSAQNIRLGKKSLVGVQREFKLRKKLSCPNCKSTLTPNKQTRENKDYFYYVCPSCKKFSISASYLEKESCRLIKNYVLDGKQFKLLVEKLLKDQTDFFNHQSKKRKNIKNHKEKLMKQFEDGKIDDIYLLEEMKRLKETAIKEPLKIQHEQLEHTLKQLMSFQESPVDDVLFSQIDKIVLTINKKIKEIYLHGVPTSIV